jgi:hypothetical protein
MSEEHPAPGADPATPPQPVPAEPIAAPEAPPVSAPIIETPAEPVVEQPPTAPAEPAEPGLKPHTDQVGLLGTQAGEPTTETPAEAPAEPSEPEITYEFKLPEGVELGGEQLEEFTSLARELHVPPEQAQRLVDMHIAALQAHDAAQPQKWHDQFAETRNGWRNEIMSDPVYGGAGFKTNQQHAIAGLSALVTEAQKMLDAAGHPLAEPFGSYLDQALLSTGLTDHRAFFILGLAADRLAEKLREPAPLPAPTPLRPIPGAGGRAPGAAGSRISYAYPRGQRRDGG